MDTELIHRTASRDGTEIAARVQGQGPPVVLVHGALGSGETAWVSLLPFLTDRFTCFPLSLRGRGLSGPSDDLGRDRAIEDVVAMAESIGQPVGMIGLSSGALLSLAAAERSDAIGAVAAYEPPVFELMTDELRTDFMDGIDRVTAAAADGRPADAAEIFIRIVTNDDEFAAASAMDLFNMFVPNVGIQVKEFAPFIQALGPTPTDPAELKKIAAPVLLVHGTRSMPHPWFADAIRHCATHIPDVKVAAIEGAGHLGPILAPEAVGAEIVGFLTKVLQTA